MRKMEPYIPKTLPPAAINWEQHVSNIAQANSHLARFDGILQTIPNPELLLAPIMTQEAVLSSRIEGTQAILEDVLEFDAEPSEEIRNFRDVQEVNNYRKTLQYAIQSLKQMPLTLNLIKEMHKILLEGVRGNNKGRGEFRKTQNWMGRTGATIEQATFISPSPIDLSDHLSSFERYFHFNDKEKLVQLAIIHAQFELLHPFLDGNGRIGRILTPLFLYEKQLISHPSFYISGFFDLERDAYYDRLENISTNNSWDDWIEFFLQAVIFQAKAQSSLAKQTLRLYDEIKIEAAEITRSHLIIKTLDFIFAHPIFKSSSFVKVTDIPRATAHRLLNSLVEGGILLPGREKTGRAGQIYRFDRLLQLLMHTPTNDYIVGSIS
ncbi:MAG: Fic family protein [Parachlamydiaceae bacterium]